MYSLFLFFVPYSQIFIIHLLVLLFTRLFAYSFHRFIILSFTRLSVIRKSSPFAKQDDKKVTKNLTGGRVMSTNSTRFSVSMFHRSTMVFIFKCFNVFFHLLVSSEYTFRYLSRFFHFSIFQYFNLFIF